MSDEERDNDATSEPPPPPRPRKKKKKRREDVAVARSAARARLAAEPVAAPAPSWTNGHLAGALAIGLVLGGLGGYAMWGRNASSNGGAVAKDSAAAQAPTRGAQSPTARPQPPPEPATPVYIALAPHSPREGPEHAKVTILEFSDFQ